MWSLTTQALKNLRALTDPIDVVIVDDASEDRTAQRARALGYTVLGGEVAVGLTAGWNRAYKLFMESPQ